MLVERDRHTPHPGHVDADGHPWPQIDTPDQLLLVANAQNLAARWQNVITRATSGVEQLQWMRESGVFADDLALTFRMPDGSLLDYTGLTDEPLGFYTKFLEGLVKVRNNIGANLEVLSFGEDTLRFRFRYVINMGNQPSLFGDNDCTMQKRNGRYVLTRATIDVTVFEAEHAYKQQT